MKDRSGIIELPWPPVVLGPNIKRHWAVKHKAFQEYKGWCKTLAFKHEPMMCFSIEFLPPGRHRRDRDNLIASFKAGQDGLADAWNVDDGEFQILYKPFDRNNVVPYGKVIIEEIKQ